MKWKKPLKIGVLCFLVMTAGLMTINFWIVSTTADKIHYEMAGLAPGRVGLILGTSKSTTKGHSNKYFDERIATAVDLYNNRKVKQLIVSGDNRTRYYNEPKDMFNALIAKGIPESVIILDYEGTGTLESVVRSKLVFNADKILIITQDFHCYRALFIADYFGIDAEGYSADKRGALPVFLAFRELFARIKAVFDLYISKETPHYFETNTQQ